MKTTIMYAALFLMGIFSIGCALQNSGNDADVSIVIDKTDPLAVYPTAEGIISSLGLKDNPFQAVRVSATYVSDKDINDVSVLTLEGENRWMSNINLRKAKVQQFTRQLQQCLAGMKFTGTCPRSIIYRTVARQADRLATSTAIRRYLLVYSDLYENNVDLNFYRPQTISRLRKAPKSIEQQLEATVPLSKLNGIDTWLIYNPASFEQNNAYMVVANFYKQMLEAKGATVHIGNTINL